LFPLNKYLLSSEIQISWIVAFVGDIRQERQRDDVARRWENSVREGDSRPAEGKKVG
jgi:hypothetical protein